MTASDAPDPHGAALQRAAARLRLAQVRPDPCSPTMATGVRYDHARRGVVVRLVHCGDNDGAAARSAEFGADDRLRGCGQTGPVAAFEVTAAAGHAALGCTCDAAR